MTEARATRLDIDNVAIIIPALNEELRIRGVVQDALSVARHVIVIDDGSTDATAERIADLPLVAVLRHAQRQGKGASLRDGFAEALRRGFAAVITMDGDGQHAASDIPPVCGAPNRPEKAFGTGGALGKRGLQPTYRTMANQFGDWGIAWGTGYQIVDTQSGQRLYPANVCALRDVPGEDFVFEAQILISAAQQLGTRCVSVPIESRYQSTEAPEQFRKSHFRPLRDLWRITSHVVAQVLRRGDILAQYRRVRANPPVIDDPSGEFAPHAHARATPASH